MGLIRSGLVVIVASVLFLSLFLGNAFLTLDWSLEYDTVQPQIADFAIKMVGDSGISDSISENYKLMEIYCENYPSFVYSDDTFSMEIPCEVIHEGIDSVIEYGTKEMVEDFYYREYNCSFFECLKEQQEPFVLVSKKAKDYWSAKFNLALIVSIILVVLLFLIMETKHSTLTVTGILMVLAALPFRKLNWVIGFLPDGDFTSLILAFFTKSYNVFMIMTIIGASLFALGIAFEFLGFGLRISKFLGLFKKKKSDSSENKGKKGQAPLSEFAGETFTKEEVAEIVREELEKEKKKKNTKKKDSTQDLGLSI